MKVFNTFAALIPFTLFLTGCGSTIPPLDFTVRDVPTVTRQDVELVSVTVGYVPKTKGMKIETNHLVPPSWQSALEDAINRSLVFGDDKERKVSISVRIDHFDLPAAGFTMTSNCGAVYEILDRSSGDLIFDVRIFSSGSVPTDYAFVGVVRAAESINRCARNNISEFLTKVGESSL